MVLKYSHLVLNLNVLDDICQNEVYSIVSHLDKQFQKHL